MRGDQSRQVVLTAAWDYDILVGDVLAVNGEKLETDNNGRRVRRATRSKRPGVQWGRVFCINYTSGGSDFGTDLLDVVRRLVRDAGDSYPMVWYVSDSPFVADPLELVPYLGAMEHRLWTNHAPCNIFAHDDLIKKGKQYNDIRARPETVGRSDLYDAYDEGDWELVRRYFLELLGKFMIRRLARAPWPGAYS